MRPSSSKPTSHSLRYACRLPVDAHVVVFVVDDARRPAGFVGHERGHHRRDRGLRFLAAERAAHPLADAHDLVLADAEHLGHDGLNLGRVLRRRVDDHLALLAGIGDRRLRFEIELLLPAAGEHAAEPVRRGGQLLVDVAASDAPPRAEELLADGSIRPDPRAARPPGIRLVTALRAFSSAAGDLGRHDRHRLAEYSTSPSARNGSSVTTTPNILWPGTSAAV